MQGMHSHQWLVLLPIPLIVVLLWGLLESTFWVRGLRLVVCTEGVLRLWRDEAESIRWGRYRNCGATGTAITPSRALMAPASSSIMSFVTPTNWARRLRRRSPASCSHRSWPYTGVESRSDLGRCR